MEFQYNRQIGYTKSWLYTACIAGIVGLIFCFILIFLQPFDTYANQMPYKNLKLAGYFLPIFISILGLHFFENLWFNATKRWLLYQEVAVMMLGTLLLTFLSFLYLNSIVNETAVPWNQFFIWVQNFGLPFAPIILMLWSYLRFRFSKIDLKPTLTSAEKTCIITGNNSKEEYSFFWNQFLLAKSQSNYVEVYLLDAKTDNTEKIMIRNTLSNLLSQLPEAVQVHRSYIVNIDKIEKLTGNVRKGGCTIFCYPEQVPVSPKHFKALKSGLNI